MIPLETTTKSRTLMAFVLALIAGYVDAYGFITFDTFVSFMSGNTTHAGFKVGQGGFDLALPAAVAISSFVLGSFAGTMITSSRFRYARRILFLSITAMLALDIGITYLTSIVNETGIAMLSFTMGMMNTTLTRVGKQEVNITFVTGMLSQLGGHLAHAVKGEPLKNVRGMWNTHLRRALLLSVMWGCFLAGAVAGGAATPKFGVWMLLLPLLIMLAMGTLVRRAAED